MSSPNKAVNPSGGSGVFWNQGYLAAAGLPWSFGDYHRHPWLAYTEIELAASVPPMWVPET